MLKKGGLQQQQDMAIKFSMKGLGRLWAIVPMYSCETRQFSVGWPKADSGGQHSSPPWPQYFTSPVLEEGQQEAKPVAVVFWPRVQGLSASGRCPAELALEDSAKSMGRIIWK